MRGVVFGRRIETELARDGPASFASPQARCDRSLDQRALVDVYNAGAALSTRRFVGRTEGRARRIRGYI